MNTEPSEATTSTMERRFGAIFSSSKCPAEASCELPFGFLWSPFQTPNRLQRPYSTTLTGSVCTTCLAYYNLYCETKPTSDGKLIWNCVFCGAQNVAKDPKQLQERIQPTFEFRQPVTHKSNHDKRTLIVVMDANLLPNEAHAAVRALETYMEASKTTSWRIGLIVFHHHLLVYRLGVSTGVLASCDVLANHTHLSKNEDDNFLVQDSLQSFKTCVAARFGVPSAQAPRTDAAIARNGDTSSNPPKLSRLEMLKQRKLARMQQKEAKSDVSTATESVPSDGSSSTTGPSWQSVTPQLEIPHAYRNTGEAIQCAMDLAANETGTTGRILLFTNGCPNYGDGSCVDPQAPTICDPSRIALSREYFSLVAKTGVEDGLAIDVFCTGSAELGLPVYQSLVEPTAGYVLSMDSFTEYKQLGRNLRFVLDETKLSLGNFADESTAPKPEVDEIEGLDLESPPMPNEGEWIEGCLIDIRLSSFLTPTHLVGPGDLLPSPSEPLVNERLVFDEGIVDAKACKIKTHKQLPSVEMLESSLTRIRLGRYDPLSTFSVLVKTNDFYQRDEYAMFQLIVRYVEGDSYVTRVHTYRLAVVTEVGEFLEAVDEEVVPTLLGKEAVYRSMFGRDAVEDEQPVPYSAQMDRLAYDAQRDLDHTIFRISGAFRLLNLEQGTKSVDLTEEGGIKAAASSMDFAFPPELSDALRRLFHLRRGPFLSPGPLQSLDDRTAMRSLFIRFPLEDCLSMMAPTLWSSGPLEKAQENGPALEDLPPETLALWTNRIIAADHWNNLYVWTGNEATGHQNDPIRNQMKEYLVERAVDRFPAPSLHSLTELDSMSRRFTAILAPLHGDPVEHQLAHFPALATLSAHEQQKLRARFVFYDPESDPSFRKWFWEVASASGSGKDEGVSLCD